MENYPHLLVLRTGMTTKTTRPTLFKAATKINLQRKVNKAGGGQAGSEAEVLNGVDEECGVFFGGAGIDAVPKVHHVVPPPSVSKNRLCALLYREKFGRCNLRRVLVTYANTDERTTNMT